MLYKRKQVYWIDTVYKDKRIKECTGSKSKKKAEEYASRLMRDLMIQDRLGVKDSSELSWSYHPTFRVMKKTVITLSIICLLNSSCALKKNSAAINSSQESRTVVNCSYPFTPSNNLVLFLFNLIPAFPMDGGRMLRSLLARRMSYLRATVIAARLGQFSALWFSIYVLFEKQYPLVFVGVFVFFSAQFELNQTRALQVSEMDGGSLEIWFWI